MHKYRFGSRCKYLKSTPRYKHFRIFPKAYNDPKDYVEKYFEINCTKFVE